MSFSSNSTCKHEISQLIHRWQLHYKGVNYWSFNTCVTEWYVICYIGACRHVNWLTRVRCLQFRCSSSRDPRWEESTVHWKIWKGEKLALSFIIAMEDRDVGSSGYQVRDEDTELFKNWPSLQRKLAWRMELIQNVDSRASLVA